MASEDKLVSKGFGDPRYRSLIGGLVTERKRQGLSQDALAKLLGRHQQFVSRYETGERRLDIIEFIDVGRALGCDIGTLISTVP